MSRVPIQLTFLFTSWVAAGAALHAASTDLLPQTPTNVSSLRTLDAQVREATRKALPAVVAISSLKGGSGVIISEDGLVLSQAHVTHGRAGIGFDPQNLAQPGSKTTVILHDGAQREAVLLGADMEYDLSLIKIVPPGPYGYTPLDAGRW